MEEIPRRPGGTASKGRPRHNLYTDTMLTHSDPLIKKFARKRCYKTDHQQHQPKHQQQQLQHQQNNASAKSLARQQRYENMQRATISHGGSDFSAFGLPTSTFPLGDGSACRQLLATVHHLYEQLCLERVESDRLKNQLKVRTQELKSAWSILERSKLVDNDSHIGSQLDSRPGWCVYHSTNCSIQSVPTNINVSILVGRSDQDGGGSEGAQQRLYGSRYEYEWSITAYDESSRAMHIGVFAEVKLHQILSGTAAEGLLEQLDRLCRPNKPWKQPQIVEASEKRIAVEIVARLEFDGIGNVRPPLIGRQLKIRPPRDLFTVGGRGRTISKKAETESTKLFKQSVSPTRNGGTFIYYLHGCGVELLNGPLYRIKKNVYERKVLLKGKDLNMYGNRNGGRWSNRAIVVLRRMAIDEIGASSNSKSHCWIVGLVVHGADARIMYKCNDIHLSTNSIDWTVVNDGGGMIPCPTICLEDMRTTTTTKKAVSSSILSGGTILSENEESDGTKTNQNRDQDRRRKQAKMEEKLSKDRVKEQIRQLEIENERRNTEMAKSFETVRERKESNDRQVEEGKGLATAKKREEDIRMQLEAARKRAAEVEQDKKRKEMEEKERQERLQREDKKKMEAKAAKKKAAKEEYLKQQEDLKIAERERIEAQNKLQREIEELKAKTQKEQEEREQQERKRMVDAAEADRLKREAEQEREREKKEKKEKKERERMEENKKRMDDKAAKKRAAKEEYLKQQEDIKLAEKERMEAREKMKREIEELKKASQQNIEPPSKAESAVDKLKREIAEIKAEEEREAKEAGKSKEMTKSIPSSTTSKTPTFFGNQKYDDEPRKKNKTLAAKDVPGVPSSSKATEGRNHSFFGSQLYNDESKKPNSPGANLFGQALNSGDSSGDDTFDFLSLSRQQTKKNPTSAQRRSIFSDPEEEDQLFAPLGGVINNSDGGSGNSGGSGGSGNRRISFFGAQNYDDIETVKVHQPRKSSFFDGGGSSSNGDDDIFGGIGGSSLGIFAAPKNAIKRTSMFSMEL
jgi:hypothetical protein